MPTHHGTEPALTPELEAIATAADELLQAQCDERSADVSQLHARMRDAASAAIASGTELDALAPAKRIGQNRARQQLSKDVLRAVARAAKSKRETDAA